MKTIYRLAVLLSALVLLAILARHRSGTSERNMQAQESAMSLHAKEPGGPDRKPARKKIIAPMKEAAAEATEQASLSGGESDGPVSPEAIDAMLEKLEHRMAELRNE